jgi:hypothetical protein
MEMIGVSGGPVRGNGRCVIAGRGSRDAVEVIGEVLEDREGRKVNRGL